MPYVQYLFGAKAGNLVTDRKHLGAWWERVSKRPSWVKVSA
jgi:glutathione S-transferase